MNSPCLTGAELGLGINLITEKHKDGFLSVNLFFRGNEHAKIRGADRGR
jgi:hypothetical protein